jgi:hypothetical protein
MQERGRLIKQEEPEEGGRDSMKWLKNIRAGLLALSMLTLASGQTALAADDTAYTYTIRLYAGNQGVLTGEGITAPGEGTRIEKITGKSGQVEQIVVSGVKYGETVYINPNDAAKETDERYYIRGVRRSGRDNSEAVASTGAVGADMDYVIAYGVSGETTPYTINYQDAAGNTLLPSDTYYGNIGERQYVSARYVDGYQPQAYNMVMTLSSNSAENVFNFVYTPIETPTEPETPATPPAAAPTETLTAPAGTPTETPAAEAGAETPPQVPAVPAEGVGGDVAVPDDAVPQGNAPDNIIDKDEEVPMAESMKQAQPGTVMGYLPVYIGIGAAAVLALAGTALYLRKRRKAAVVKAGRTTLDDEQRVK